MKQEDTNLNLFVIIGGALFLTLLIDGFFIRRASHIREVEAQQQREQVATAQREQAAKEARDKEERDRVAAAQREQAVKDEAERQERERAAAALQEQERIAAEQRERIAREERERPERERAAAAQREQSAREAKEQEERERIAAERRDQLAKDEAARAVREAEARAEAARQEAATAHALYLARYLNAGYERTPQTPTIAVAVASEQRKVNRELATALAQRFGSPGLRVLPSFFKPELVADGLLTNLISGRTDVIANLELTNSLDALLLGQQKVEYSTNASLANTVTANLWLELMALPVRASAEKQSWRFSAVGVGFQPHEARALAEERMLNQIARDTNMVLAPSLPRSR